MNVEQPKLGRRGTLFLLIILGAFPPLTMDMYLPALPQMAEGFETRHAMVNMTLGAFMVAFAVGMLFWGPLSERTGRKPILFTTLAIYIVSSLLCAVVFNIESLIGFRVIQGLSGGGVTVVGTAIVKDLYDGREREKVMATVMSLVIIAPMVAPVLGAFLLQIASWRMVFVVLALFGCLAGVLVSLYSETVTEKSTAPIAKSWNRLAVVLMNPRFAYLLLLFSLVPMCLMAFLGTAAYVYIDGFGLSEQAFSFIFAFNAACASLGPMIYMRLSGFIRVQSIILSCFAVIVLSGLVMLVFAAQSLWIFAAGAAVTTTSVIVLRIPGANLLLDQQDKDTGSAAALIQFGGTLMGAVGVQLVSTSSHDLIRNYGILLLSVGIICAIMWLAVQHRSFVADKVTKPL
ncbi:MULTISPECIES: multidrug effflux MFS transporter [Pacificibacter]|uniref:multidrug effflux MFS transporter n=1 Tax=Pacificibacter TaxID=1042323 RepID=UPI001C0A3536|nr:MULTISPECIES: multidrug effflux MFS transporter [Pacificibacter]MBU2935615.1 multidrug effflux MFS transporter [Pacificibacter marinus]MDO6614111.1 multidrug effflux MFS transporter [Pacificibacter sp. 1_MG-2023]